MRYSLALSYFKRNFKKSVRDWYLYGIGNPTSKTTIFEELVTETIMLKDSDLTVTQVNRQKMELSDMAHLHTEVGGIKSWSKLCI